MGTNHLGHCALTCLLGDKIRPHQAVTTDLRSGTYLAPRFNQWGKPKVAKLRRKARDPVVARRLWEHSAEVTGCD